MQFSYTVDVTVERVEGKFASRDEIGEAIENALGELDSMIDLSGLGADGTSEYEVTDLDYSEEPPKPGRSRRWSR